MPSDGALNQANATSFPRKRESRPLAWSGALPPKQAGFRLALRLAGMTVIGLSRSERPYTADATRLKRRVIPAQAGIKADLGENGVCFRQRDWIPARATLSRIDNS